VLVDGNDTLGIHRATKRTVETTRNDNTTPLVEALTYRRGAHSTSDDPGVYRDEAEVEEWAEPDPIDRYETFLEDRGLWSEEYAAGVREDAEQRAKKASENAINIANEQTAKEVFDEVYSNPPPELDRQHEELE
jgi:pyruvate dehydrogenase E1 component alpha subunit